MKCSKCGVAVSDTARFCGECGEAISASLPDSDAERRQITVLFIDLVGSSRLSESLDPEELRALLGAYQAACARIIERYDGHVAQYLGDGILVYFGFPTAHEDDAVRAVQSGLVMLSELEGLEAQGRRLHVRIGIHTGLVVVGDVGAGERREQLALGEAPNMAARLQGQAETDTLLISEPTRLLVGGQFALEERGTCALKGSSHEVAVFRVMGRSEASTSFQAKAAAGLTPFVGREQEIETIRAACAAGGEGGGRTTLLRGAAGVGKSRLLGVARSVAEGGQFDLFDAQCSPYGENDAFHPIIGMLARGLGLGGASADESLDAIERFVAERGATDEDVVPLLAELLGVPTGERYPPLPYLPDRRRLRTLEMLGAVVAGSADGGRTALFLEDLHWADPSTQELVEGLVKAQGDRPLFMVCTTRPEGEVSWTDEPHCTEMNIEAFAQDDVRAMIAGVVGPKPLPEELVRQLIARTDGTPLFVEAVTRTVLETGLLREQDDQFELTGPLPPDLIPTTVQDSLVARIDRLGPHKPVAQMASAIGREFSFDLLQHVSGSTTDHLGRALGQLVEMGLVTEEGTLPAATYTFNHALVQEAAYKLLLRTTRQEYHGKIADALVTNFPERVEARPAELARHLEGAGKIGQAVDHWMAAGVQAQQRSAALECIAHLRKAVALVTDPKVEDPDLDDDKRVAIETAAQLSLGPALMSARGWGAREVEEACLRAQALCAQTQNGEGMFQALWGLWTVLFVRGELGPALQAAQTILQMAYMAENPIGHIAAHHAVGFTHYYRGEFQDAREHAEKGLALYNLEQERILVQLFQIPSSLCCGVVLTQSLFFLGHPDQAAARHEANMEMVEDLANPTCTAIGMATGTYYQFEVRDLDLLDRYTETCIAVSNEEGFRLWSGGMRIARGWIQSMRGEPEAGVAEMYAGMEEYLRTQSGLYVPHLKKMIADGLRAAGRLEDAQVELAAALELVDEHEERYYLSPILGLKGEIEIEQGNPRDGEATLRAAIDVAEEQQSPLFKLRGVVSLARLLRDEGRMDEARGLLEPAAAAFSEGQDLRELVEARALLAELASPHVS